MEHVPRQGYLEMHFIPISHYNQESGFRNSIKRIGTVPTAWILNKHEREGLIFHGSSEIPDLGKYVNAFSLYLRGRMVVVTDR